MKNLNFIIIFMLFGLSGCTNSEDYSTLDSDNFESKEARVAILKQEILSESDFSDAEFELFNVNGFRYNYKPLTLPGASYSRYKFGVRVKPTDVDKWTKGFVKTDPKNENLVWINEIIKERKNDWEVQSSPEFYVREENDAILVVFRNEGILYKHVSAD